MDYNFWRVEQYTPPHYKSRMIIGDITVMNQKHFNWFHKLMRRIILGIKIEDIKED
jgi:hypothetical protein